ncbi:hypothetical protein Pflav_009280 [Phytohabitans flavus]|uniref:Uncharacterized protein n=1 Tax=Phytohabitans flavus TaxID=1076124 RepID=A0A6F8XL47_9ACTN|nr:hypothetical protein Pflav_009280 [Phytohabitans flavus]
MLLRPSQRDDRRKTTAPTHPGDYWSPAVIDADHHPSPSYGTAHSTTYTTLGVSGMTVYLDPARGTWFYVFDPDSRRRQQRRRGFASEQAARPRRAGRPPPHRH